MKIRRYRGKSLENIRKQVVKELGRDAVIISTREEKSGNLLTGRATQYEIIAAADEGNGTSPGEGLDAVSRLEEIVREQKEQFLGVRRSIKMLDDKLVDMEEAMRISMLKQDGNSSSILQMIHDDWRAPVTEAAHDLANGHEPTEADWHEALASMIPTAAGIHFRPTPGAPPDVYCLVGPTGVGKTTSLAKMAAKCVLQERLSVGIVTIGTFRVAAVDQIREYANLLGVELKVAFAADELQSQLEQFHDKDIVFIDTPGRSQYDKAGISQIRECIGNPKQVTTILAVPASIRAKEALNIVTHYGQMEPSIMVLTKVDESCICDGLTQLIDSAGIPVVYLTDGQRVPEDIAPASPALVAALITQPGSYPMPVKFGGGPAV